MGLDLSTECLRVLKCRGYSRTSCVTGDAELPPFAAASFSLIVAASLLQSSERPEEILADAARLRVPGGRLLFAVYLEQSYHELLDVHNRLGNDRPIQLPSHEALLRMLDSSGLTVLCWDRINRTELYPSPLGMLKALAGTGSTAIA